MYKHILVPLDGSDLSDYVLPHLGTVVRDAENRPGNAVESS